MHKLLLLVDAHLEYCSPSMQHILHSLPHLREAGWELQAWCLRSDAPGDMVKHVFIPAPRWLGPFELLYFTLAVNLYGLWRKLAGPPIEASIIHATCGTYLGAHLVSVHFVNAIWTRMQLKSGFTSWKNFAKFLFDLCGVAIERLNWWSPSTRKIIAVSDSIGEEVRRRAPKHMALEVLPLSYDESRFHSGVRALYRQPKREELGFTPQDFVFVFASQGHYERKGFWLALSALARLRNAGRTHLRLLVIGGTPQSLHQLQSRLATEAPDWKQWVRLAGSQPRIEEYMAAGDAFLFPSKFETYALVVMEAALIGLPLLLTSFHGSEMTLQAGVNGVKLSSEPAQMSLQIAEFLDKGLPPFTPGPGRGLSRPQYAAELLRIYERLLENSRPAA